MFLSMPLKTEGAPDTVDGHAGDPCFPRDRTDRPVRGLFGFALQGLADQHHDDRILKLLRSRIVDETGTSGKPGEILKAGRELYVVAGRGVLSIVELQLEGRRVLNVEAFLRGYSLSAGDFLVTRL
jgi:methionyl-tRNA formyltransferase